MDTLLVFFYGTLISTIFGFGIVKYLLAIKKEQTQQIQNHYENWGN